MKKSRQIERRIICNILLKNADVYFLLATVEGEKSEGDASVYFVVQSKHNNRDEAFQYSYHHSQKNGLVRTHVKGMEGVSCRLQKPLQSRDRAILSVHLNDFTVSDSLQRDCNPNDIVLSIKSEFVKFCCLLFYTTEESLTDYARVHNEIILNKYKIPTKYSQVGFAVLMQREKLEEIQSRRKSRSD